MSTEVDFVNHGLQTMGANQVVWFGLFNGNFDSGRWQRVSVFPSERNPALVPHKVTIVQEDWTLDEQRLHVCWLLVRNDLAENVEFGTTFITVPNT
jgi:hypothetical protein